jgi:hypothetical protein
LESIPFVFVGKESSREAINARRSEGQHAERCGELARLASTQEARETFLSLQMTWIRLAMELQQAGALIKAVQDLEEQPLKAAE